MTSRSWPVFPDIGGNSDANFMRVVILWFSRSLRVNSTASRANVFMFTGWCSCLPLNKLRKLSNTSLRAKSGTFYILKSLRLPR